MTKHKRRLEGLAREECGHGIDLVEFWGKLFRGEPLTQTVVRFLPVPKGGPPPDPPWVAMEVPYYPTMEDRRWASERLAERGWGKARQDVTVDDGESRGVVIVHRRWPVGVDPLASQERANREQVVNLPALPPAGHYSL